MTCAFSVQGLAPTKTINSAPIVFEQVDLNICDGYNVTIGRELTHSSTQNLNRIKHCTKPTELAANLCISVM